MGQQLDSKTGSTVSKVDRRPTASAFHWTAGDVPANPLGPRLAVTVERRVIPRLILAHGLRPSLMRAAERLAIPQMVDAFAQMVMSPDESASIQFCETLLAQGAPAELLYAELLGPTARRLGRLWDCDARSLFDVAQGLSQLQYLVATFADKFRGSGAPPTCGRRALLMPYPGDEHTFGLSMVQQHFIKDGWQLWSDHPSTIEAVGDLVRAVNFDLVGFSIARLSEPRRVATAIRLIRSASCNPDLAIMAGGAALIDQPALVAIIGADATALDGRRAVRHMAAYRPKLAVAG